MGLSTTPLGCDPDKQVQHSVRLLFDTFTRRLGLRHGFNNEKRCFRTALKAGRTGVSCIGSP